MKRWASAALSTLAASGALCVAGAAPASAAPPIQIAKSCPNSYECLINFNYATFNPITIDVDSNGGPEQPVALAVDYTEDIPNCHPTIYPSQPVRSFTCSQMYKGSFAVKVYGGNPHDHYLAVRW